MTHTRGRRPFLVALASLAVLSPVMRVAASQGESSMSDPILELLQQSMSSKRGVTVALDGTTVALVVTEITDEHVIGQSQQHDRIVIRLAAIQAAYM